MGHGPPPNVAHPPTPPLADGSGSGADDVVVPLNNPQNKMITVSKKKTSKAVEPELDALECIPAFYPILKTTIGAAGTVRPWPDPVQQPLPPRTHATPTLAS